MSVIAAVVAALLVGAPAASYDLSIRTEAGRSRLDPREQGKSTKGRTAAELALTGGVSLDSQRWNLQLDYAPRVWTPKLEPGSNPQLDHRLILRSRFLGGPWVSGGLNVIGTRGILDPLADPWTDYSPTGSVFPNDQPQPYESVNAAADLSVRAGARTLLAFTGIASVSRGRDPTARLIMPLQGRLGGLLVAGYSAGARDRWSFIAEANSSRTCPGECPDGFIGPKAPAVPEFGHPYVSESVTGMSGVRWEHDFTPAQRALFTVGASFVREVSLDPSRTDVFRTAPGAEAGYTHRSERSGLSVNLLLRYLPAIDRTNGRIRQMLSGSTDLGWIASPVWTVAATAAASAALDREANVYLVATGKRREPGDPTSLGTQLSAQRRLDSGAVLQFGLRWRWQKDSLSPQGSFNETGLFVAFDWALSRARPPRIQPPGPQAGPGRPPAGS